MKYLQIALHTHVYVTYIIKITYIGFFLAENLLIIHRDVYYDISIIKCYQNISTN